MPRVAHLRICLAFKFRLFQLKAGYSFDDALHAFFILIFATYSGVQLIQALMNVRITLFGFLQVLIDRC